MYSKVPGTPAVLQVPKGLATIAAASLLQRRTRVEMAERAEDLGCKASGVADLKRDMLFKLTLALAALDAPQTPKPE